MGLRGGGGGVSEQRITKWFYFSYLYQNILQHAISKKAFSVEVKIFKKKNYKVVFKYLLIKILIIKKFLE